MGPVSPPPPTFTVFTQKCFYPGPASGTTFHAASPLVAHKKKKLSPWYLLLSSSLLMHTLFAIIYAICFVFCYLLSFLLFLTYVLIVPCFSYMLVLFVLLCYLCIYSPCYTIAHTRKTLVPRAFFSRPGGKCQDHSHADHTCLWLILWLFNDDSS